MTNCWALLLLLLQDRGRMTMVVYLVCVCVAAAYRLSIAQRMKRYATTTMTAAFTIGMSIAFKGFLPLTDTHNAQHSTAARKRRRRRRFTYVITSQFANS